MNIKDILFFLENHEISAIYYGRNDISIRDVCSISNIQKECITWMKEYSEDDLCKINSDIPAIIITNEEYKHNGRVKEYNIITVEKPRVAFFLISNHLGNKKTTPKICSSSTILTKNIGNNVSIGHNCFIDKDVIIGDNVTIANRVSIECPTTIGDNTVIASGVVVGSDGFGYIEHKGKIIKVRHRGGVSIGKNVEIGANTCIDRGTLDDTRIEDGVKIDNLCHIAHNVHIEPNSYLVAFSLLCGGAHLGEHTYVGPSATVLNQLRIEENVFIGAGAVVIGHLPANKVVAGIPARILRENLPWS